MLLHGGALIDVEFDGSAPTPVVVKEQQRDPVRGRLHPPRPARGQARRGDPGRGPDRAAGHRGGARRQGGRRARARHPPDHDRGPADRDPREHPADVSGMSIGDTLQLSAVSAPEGVEFALGEGVDADEVTIATLSPPRVEEEPEPELEEEAELVGEEGEVPEGEEAPEGEARRRAMLPPRASDSEGGVAPLSLLGRLRRGRAARTPMHAGERRPRARRRPGKPGARSTAQTRHNLGFEVAAELSRRWDLPRAEGALSRPDHRGPGRRPGAPRRGPPARRLHERVGELGGSGARSAQGAAREARRAPRRDRPARSARSAPGSAAGSPATTG